MDRVKRNWYLSPMWAAKVQASLRIRAVSPEPPLVAHTSSESRGTFRQKARSLAPLNGWACAVKICHDGMLKDTNSLDAPQMIPSTVITIIMQIICNREFVWHFHRGIYRNDPKFSDRYAWANSADPDQTAPRGAVCSGATLFAILSASFALITLW